ncbi:MAG: septum formation initiator family protein [bacterium]|nr:septum formation initiator family protein [bacterium]
MREKDFFKKMFFSRIFVVFLAALTILVAVSTGRALWRKHQVDREIQKLQKDISQIEERNKELLTRLDYLKSEENLEKEARLQLNVKRPGEKVVVILGNGASSSPAEEKIGDSAGEKISNPQKWWRYFFY